MKTDPLTFDGFVPTQIVDIELGSPFAGIERAATRDGHAYGAALVLVRIHSVPVGQLEVPLRNGRLSATALAAAIWAELAPAITEHLAQDGLPSPDTIEPSGLRAVSAPACLAARRGVLESPPRVSVIVPTRDRADLLELCVRSLLATEYPAERWELIVADNIPATDQTAKLVARLGARAPNLHYVRADRPGQAFARTYGALRARGEILAFVDDDVIADPQWLVEMVAGFGGDPRVGCVTGLVLPRELDTPAQGWFEQYGGFTKGFESRLFRLDAPPADDPLFPFRTGRFGSGNSMAFRRRPFAMAGGFDPVVGNGQTLVGEDADLFLRIILSGEHLAYRSAAVVHHLHRREYAALRRQLRMYGASLVGALINSLARHPRSIPHFLGRIPGGLKFALGSGAAKNVGKRSDFPSDLTRQELLGMAGGPLAYMRSYRRHKSSRLRVPPALPLDRSS